MAQKEQKARTFHLQSGITLSIHQTTAVPAEAIEDFLGNALKYFQNREEAEKTRRGYNGHWALRTPSGRSIHGKGELFHPGDVQGVLLCVQSWVDALASAYSIVSTLAQIKGDLSTYKAMTQPDDWLTEVVSALEKRGGDMDAFDIMLKRNSG